MSVRFVYVYSMVDDPDRVRSVAARHAEYWHRLGLAGYSGGPFADRSGGLITFLADDVAQAEAAVVGDPFATEGLTADYYVKQWEPEDAAYAPVPAEADSDLPVDLRLQMIGMEQWALLSTRSLTWTESFSRASMFLATLSGGIIGLALAAQATSFGRGFLWFALVVLAVVLFVGVATFVRLVAVNGEDVLWVRGLNRLRHACLELAPGMERYFVAASHDDEAGVLHTLGTSSHVRGLYHHVFVTTPAVVGIIDAVLGASIAAAISLLAGLTSEASIGIALATFLAVAIALVAYQLRAFRDGRPFHAVRFPTPVNIQPEGAER